MGLPLTPAGPPQPAPVPRLFSPQFCPIRDIGFLQPVFRLHPPLQGKQLSLGSVHVAVCTLVTALPSGEWTQRWQALYRPRMDSDLEKCRGLGIWIKPLNYMGRGRSEGHGFR